MFDWLKTKLHQKKVAEQMRKHMASATGLPLHRGIIAVAMAALDNDLVQEEMSRVRSDQRNVFMMTYECIVMWAILRGFDLVGTEKPVQTGIVTAMIDHFARQSFYVREQFAKLWEETRKWMPEFAKPSKEGKYYPAAAIVQIPHAAACHLDFIPSLVFGIHLINILEEMTDTGKFAAQQELQQQAPRPGSALEAALEAGSTLIVSGYRGIAAKCGCAPSMMMSDEKIIEVYARVCKAFREASERRGERIPAVFLNRIVLYFLQCHEKFPERFFDEHLRYEVDKYMAQGLRPEYQNELPLFPADVPGSKVSVSIDQLTRPGALMSGKVNFSDGKSAEWIVDQAGRLGLVPAEKGYNPRAADLQEFQIALQAELQKLGI
jgi:hypothetical protein